MHWKPAAGLAAALVFCSVTASAQSSRSLRFQEMDTNHDGVITRDEWRGSDQSFKVHDWNHDGVLSGDEVRIGAWRRDAPEDNADFDSPNREYEFDDWTDRGFRALDHNRDGRITLDEWHFDRAGYERGKVEGLEAGREDRETRHGWDLEGQRELESADSGYDARVGSRAEYQAGYREGFRAAYREGFEKGR